jgi:hypothetical protein
MPGDDGLMVLVGQVFTFNRDAKTIGVPERAE